MTAEPRLTAYLEALTRMVGSPPSDIHPLVEPGTDPGFVSIIFRTSWPTVTSTDHGWAQILALASYALGRMGHEFAFGAEWYATPDRS